MRKDILACTITLTMTLCLSTFLITDGTAEEAMTGNVAQSDSSTVTMHDAALSFTAHSVAAPDTSTDGIDTNYLILVQGGGKNKPKPAEDKKEPCKEAQCSYQPPGPGATAVDGSACTSGVVCTSEGHACMSGTGACTTVQLGGGRCSCPCVPN